MGRRKRCRISLRFFKRIKYSGDFCDEIPLYMSSLFPFAGPTEPCSLARRFFERNPETGSDTSRFFGLPATCDSLRHIALLFDLDTTAPNRTPPRREENAAVVALGSYLQLNPMNKSLQLSTFTTQFPLSRYHEHATQTIMSCCEG